MMGNVLLFLIRSGIIDLGVFLRRVMVIFRQQKNFGPNVIYSVLGTLYRLYVVQSDP